jgi:uncharacterized protein YbjT (DUF2867 family)
MNLVLLGASGGVGQQLGRLALARGHQIVAVVRPSTTYTPPEGARVVRGDPADPSVLDEALHGADAVLSCLGIKRRSVANPWSAITSPADLATACARAHTAAMKRHGVRRIVAVSAAGVGDSGPRMNLVMRALVATSSIGIAYRDLASMEAVYAESGLEWLAPRPTRLTDGPVSGRVKVVESFGSFDAISRADVAAWMLDALDLPGWPDPTWGGRTPQITGT